jgi:Family of unknown function (DUF6196)
MVSISQERPVESERRLRAVLRAAELQHLEGTWCFKRITGDAPAGAIATVRDVDGWCALVPTNEDATERFALTLTTFSPRIENSGYVGWIATAVKQRLGSGVFVVCSDNPERGGIFDYLGYPAKIANSVRALLDELGAPLVDDPLNLDLRVFKPVETSPVSEITSDTRLECRERDNVVEATYAGGGSSGYLIGVREDDHIRAAYVQLGMDGEPKTGTAKMRVEQGSGGRLLLIEEYTWSDGRSGRNVLEYLKREFDS